LYFHFSYVSPRATKGKTDKDITSDNVETSHVWADEIAAKVKTTDVHDT